MDMQPIFHAKLLSLVSVKISVHQNICTKLKQCCSRVRFRLIWTRLYSVTNQFACAHDAEHTTQLWAKFSFTRLPALKSIINFGFLPPANEVFTPVCDSVREGGLCPGGLCPKGVSVQGGHCAEGGICPGGGLCPRRGSLSRDWGLCPGRRVSVMDNPLPH